MKPKPFEIIVEFTPQSTKTGITYEAHKKGSLIRCKDCVWYGGVDDLSTCATTPEYLVPPNGYCHRAEPRKKKDDR